LREVFVYLVDMPDGVWGHCNPNPDGSYTILVNAKLNDVMRKKVYKHEICHIENDDFNKDDVDKIEYYSHKKY